MKRFEILQRHKAKSKKFFTLKPLHFIIRSLFHTFFFEF